jgi:DNA-binding Lrp family transcriptional regulator
MMMTSRDFDIMDFLTDYKIATTSTLATKFFSSETRCRKRMKQLYDNKRVKRARLSLNHDYMYYVTKPSSQYMHYLLITEFYGELMKKCNVLKFTKPKQLGNIIPDSTFLYEIDNKQYLGILEVEKSNNGFNYEKYEKFYKAGVYKEYFPYMPSVYVVCRFAKLPQNTSVKYIKIKTDMSDLVLLN